MIRCRHLLLTLVCLVAIAGCGDGTSRPGANVTVVATTTPIGDMASRVAGDAATVKVLLDPNTDPHDYEPTPSDGAAVADADVVFVNGLDLDGWINDVVTSSGTTTQPVVVTTGLTLLPGDDESPGGDPHVWLDPRNAETMVRTMTEAMSAAAPAKAETFRVNAERYITEIRALDGELEARVNTIPQAQRVIVTDHDAFGYLAARYDVRIVGAVIPSLASTAEPNARDLAALVDAIKRNQVRAVFPEASINAKLAQQIAKESGARVGGELYSDSLGDTGSGADTYLSMMRSNIESIVAGMSPT